VDHDVQMDDDERTHGRGREESRRKEAGKTEEKKDRIKKADMGYEEIKKEKKREDDDDDDDDRDEDYEPTQSSVQVVSLSE